MATLAPRDSVTPVHDTDPTIGRLVTDASRDISTLVSKEIQLAKSELKVSVKTGGVSIAMFAAAAFLAIGRAHAGAGELRRATGPAVDA